MKGIEPQTRIVWPALLCWSVLLSAGCESTGGGGGLSLGSQSEEEIWAIRCVTLHAADRFERANAYAAALKRVSGLKPELVQVLSDEDGTAVFYGRYRRAYGTDKGSERFKPGHLRDLEIVRTLRFQQANVWPFILSSMDVLPTYRSHHPEWDLTSVDGYWSLHVAVFYNTDTMRSRRSAAEEYCGLLRERGEEAYFHHAAVYSSVYVGTYPKGAVTAVQHEEPLTGMVSATMKIVDPQMLDAQKRFPISLHNGHKMYEVVRDQTGEVTERLPGSSFPVVVPKAERQIRQFNGR